MLELGEVFRRLGAQVRDLRLARGLTQAQLAEWVDVHPVHLQGLESGSRVPSVSVLVQLADTLFTGWSVFWTVMAVLFVETIVLPILFVFLALRARGLVCPRCNAPWEDVEPVDGDAW